MSENDPVRWKDATDAPSGMRALIGRAKPPARMPDDVRAAILAQIANPPPTAGPPSSGGFPGAVAIAAAAAVGVAIIVALIVSSRPGPARETADASTIEPASSPAVIAPPPSPASASPPEPASASAAPSASASASASARAKAPLPASGEADSLAAETALIGRARASLVSNPAAAIIAIDEHARRFPRGELAPEREYLRVSALRRLGRTDEAKARGKSYLTTYPSSPYVPAVRNLLSELDRP